jgi:hypothetical protein
MNKLIKVKVSDLVIPPWNPRGDADCSDLVQSIYTHGLRQPLLIDGNNNVIAGSRRLKALRDIGVEETYAYVSEASDTENRLIAIDDNLVRQPLNSIEFEKSLSDRKKIYELLHPQTKANVAGGLARHGLADDTLSFAESTARVIKKSVKSVERAVRRAEGASVKVMKHRALGHFRPSQVNFLVMLSKDQQDALVDSLVGKSSTEIRVAVDLILAHGTATALTETDRSRAAKKSLKAAKSAANAFCNKVTTALSSNDQNAVASGLKEELLAIQRTIATLVVGMADSVADTNTIDSYLASAESVHEGDSRNALLTSPEQDRLHEMQKYDYHEISKAVNSQRVAYPQDGIAEETRNWSLSSSILDIRDACRAQEAPRTARSGSNWEPDSKEFVPYVMSGIFSVMRTHDWGTEPNRPELFPIVLESVIAEAVRNYQVQMITRGELRDFVLHVFCKKFGPILPSSPDAYLEAAMYAYDLGLALRDPPPNDEDEALAIVMKRHFQNQSNSDSRT